MLTSYSLLQSTAYPASSDLDDHLHRLLTDRSSALEDLANRDIEAAELVVVPDVGHTPNLEEPESQAAMDRLLQRVLAAEAG